ncbi:MAG: hypothetical protein ACI9UA_001988 [Pseudoalteromonas tetraodonis]|jgi:hypothetical protein
MVLPWVFLDSNIRRFTIEVIRIGEKTQPFFRIEKEFLNEVFGCQIAGNQLKNRDLEAMISFYFTFLKEVFHLF